MNTGNVARLLSEFASKAEPLGVTVLREQNAKLAAMAAAAWVRSLGCDRLLVSHELALQAPEFVKAVSAQGVDIAPPGPPETTRDAPAGASLARMAVAETGSTLLSEPTLEDRSISMLCLNEIIVCPTVSLVASLDDAVPELRRLAIAGAGGMSTLVTGPSRTADIERVLTVGVQGPGTVCVLFVDEVS